MLDMQTVFKMNREESIKRNQQEQLERHKKQIAFNKREQIKTLGCIVLIFVLVIISFIVLHINTTRTIQKCVEVKGENYCVSKLG